MRTPLKSWPKRDSIELRVPRSSGRPGELSAWLMIGGMLDGCGPPFDLRCRTCLFFSLSHWLHSPFADWPQAQAHCKRAVRAGVNEGRAACVDAAGLGSATVATRSLIAGDLRRLRLRSACRWRWVWCVG